MLLLEIPNYVKPGLYSNKKVGHTYIGIVFLTAIKTHVSYKNVANEIKISN